MNISTIKETEIFHYHVFLNLCYNFLMIDLQKGEHRQFKNSRKMIKINQVSVRQAQKSKHL